MRLFVALELDEPSRAHLARVVDSLREVEPDMKWVRGENLHVTVKFLGEVAEQRLPQVARALEEAATPEDAAPMPAPALEATGLAFQPEEGRVRLVAAELVGEIGKLRALHMGVEEGFAVAGFVRENRRLWPHVTLGRCRRPLPARWREEFSAATRPHFPGPGWRPERMVLMHSIRLPEGPRYVVIASSPLATG